MTLPCETQTMSHIVESCPLTKLNGGLSRLHCVDEDAVSWLFMALAREEVRINVGIPSLSSFKNLGACTILWGHVPPWPLPYNCPWWI